MDHPHPRVREYHEENLLEALRSALREVVDEIAKERHRDGQ
jgi:hypothetical protein